MGDYKRNLRGKGCGIFLFSLGGGGGGYVLEAGMGGRNHMLESTCIESNNPWEEGKKAYRKIVGQYVLASTMLDFLILVHCPFLERFVCMKPPVQLSLRLILTPPTTKKKEKREKEKKKHQPRFVENAEYRRASFCRLQIWRGRLKTQR